MARGSEFFKAPAGMFRQEPPAKAAVTNGKTIQSRLEVRYTTGQIRITTGQRSTPWVTLQHQDVVNLLELCTIALSTDKRRKKR